MATLFTKAVRTTGNRRELYLYFRGRLLYKAWYLDNQKQYGRIVPAGEGRTLAAKATGHHEGPQVGLGGGSGERVVDVAAPVEVESLLRISDTHTEGKSFG